MKLELVKGCIAFSLNVNGIEEIEMTNEEKLKVCDKISSWIKKNPDQLNDILQILIPHFGDYECDDNPCECCGDYVERYTWEI